MRGVALMRFPSKGMLDDGMHDAADARCKDCRRLRDYHIVYGIEPYFASPSLLSRQKEWCVLFLNQVCGEAQTLNMEVKFTEIGRTLIVDFSELRHINSADVSDFTAVVATLFLGKGVNR